MILKQQIPFYINLAKIETENRRSLLGKHCSKNCFGQDLLIYAKSKWNFEEKQIFYSLKVSPSRYLLTTKWKRVISQQRNPNTTLHKWSRLTTRVMICWYHKSLNTMLHGHIMCVALLTTLPPKKIHIISVQSW